PTSWGTNPWLHLRHGRPCLPPLRGGLILGSTSGMGDRAFPHFVGNYSSAPPPALGAVPSPTCGWGTDPSTTHRISPPWNGSGVGEYGRRPGGGASAASREGRERSELKGARAQRAEGGASAAS